jgi:hypothetical protein
MAVRATLSLKPGDLMQVQFPTSKPSGVTAVVRNRKEDCFGLEFLAQLPLGDQTLNQSKVVCNPAGGMPASRELVRPACNPKTLFARLRRKQLEIKQVHREIEALNLALLLLADGEKENSESSLPCHPEVDTRPLPSQS